MRQYPRWWATAAALALVAATSGCDSDEQTCAGPNPAGCVVNACPQGFVCDFRPEAGCVSSWCGCDNGAWTCNADCGGGVCVQQGP